MEPRFILKRRIDKSKLRMGVWYEDANGNMIPSKRDIPEPVTEEGVRTYHTCFPLRIDETIYSYEDGVKKEIMTVHTSIGGGNQDVILAMANSGDYTLAEALVVYANACERCTNVLAWKYLNGKDGYPEYSEEWKNTNTECYFCRGGEK